MILVVFLLPTSSYADIRNNLVKPSYEQLTGVCEINNNDMYLIKGYLFYPKTGFVRGKIERLDDFYYVIHRTVMVEVADSSVANNASLVFYTEEYGNDSIDFYWSSGSGRYMRCDFSKSPYEHMKSLK